MKTLEEKIAVMQAAQRGEKIEWRWRNNAVDTWEPVNGGAVLTMGWDWAHADYRTAPKEMTIWVCSWQENPTNVFATSSDPTNRRDADKLVIHSKQTITY